ncbi:MAG: ABC transporter ATP-binding protein [Aquamicrobium sp.]|nr:ABC transporter ATP-binding protein [Aquamicrobium sp.]
MPAPLLDVRGLSISFAGRNGPIKVIEDLSFQVNEQETLCIVGESGSGKTVALMSMLGLLDPLSSRVEGSASFKGTDILGASKETLRQLRGREIALISQDPMTAMIPVHTIGWQIVEQIRAHTDLSSRAAWKRAVELLGEVGIANPRMIAGQYPHQLSGGMRQRAVIAMALSCNPSLLIADEPTTALDVTVQAQVLDLLHRLRRDFGSSIVLITHDMGVVAEMADRVLVMYAGRVVEHGSCEAIFADAWHPYTWGLLDSIPPLDGPRPDRLVSIPGSPPQPDRRPPGCVFAPRCRSRIAACAEPPPRQLADGRDVLCFLDHADREARRSRLVETMDQSA